MKYAPQDKTQVIQSKIKFPQTKQKTGPQGDEQGFTWKTHEDRKIARNA